MEKTVLIEHDDEIIGELLVGESDLPYFCIVHCDSKPFLLVSSSVQSVIVDLSDLVSS